jgi:ABC-2 type transport system ATP-binding protein
MGSIGVDGKLVPFIELGVGFNAELTGRENVYLNGAMLGFSQAEVEAMYDDIVAFAELERFMDQKLKNYSSGMQVRLAFSMATRAQADVLLVDEVLAVGDADFQRKCFAFFRSLKKQKKTVVFVSHDMNAVREYCDRAILIEDSELIEEGSSAKIATAYSRLFVDPEAAAADSTEKQNRWGNGAMKYTDVRCAPAVLTDEKEFTLSTTLKVYEDSDEAILGFAIKSASEVLICGTNNKLQGEKIENLKAGDELKLEWKIANILNDGDYFINLAAETGASVPCDWWDEAVKLEVFKETKTGFLIHPNIELKSSNVKHA